MHKNTTHQIKLHIEVYLHVKNKKKKKQTSEESNESRQNEEKHNWGLASPCL